MKYNRDRYVSRDSPCVTVVVLDVVWVDQRSVGGTGA